MFSRSAAWLLITLVVVPFTAPFSTCDLSLLLQSSSHGQTSRIFIGTDGRSASIEANETAQAAASVLEEEQFKDTLLADAAVVAVPNVDSTAAVREVTHASATRTTLIALRL